MARMEFVTDECILCGAKLGYDGWYVLKRVKSEQDQHTILGLLCPECEMAEEVSNETD